MKLKKLFTEYRDEIDINVKTKDINRTPLYRAVETNNLDIVSFLLTDQKIDVNTYNFYNRIIDKSYVFTPLVLAISRGNTDMVRILISHEEINVNLASDFFEGIKSGLAYCINRVEDINKKTEIVKLLLAHGDLSEKIIKNISNLDKMTKINPKLGILLLNMIYT